MISKLKEALKLKHFYRKPIELADNAEFTTFRLSNCLIV